MERDKEDRGLKGHALLSEIEAVFNVFLPSPASTMILRKILLRHGGNYIYIPTATEAYREYRDDQIRKKFKGDNHEELALEWKLTTRQIYNIISEGEDG